MRNLFLACSAILAVIVGVGVLMSFSSCYKMFRGMGSISALQNNVIRMCEQIRKQNDKYAFSPPADGIVTPEQLKNWLEVRQANIPVCEIIHAATKDTAPKDPFKHFDVIIKSQEKAVESLIAGLDKRNMTVTEYIWITNTIMALIDSGDGRASPKLKPVIAEMDSDSPSLAYAFRSDGPRLTSSQISRMLPMVESNCDPLSATLHVLSFDTTLISYAETATPQNSQ